MRHYTPTVYITVQSWCRVSVDLLLMSATVVHWFAYVVIIRSCRFTSSVNDFLSVSCRVVYVVRFCAVRSIAGVNRVSAPWCRVGLRTGIVSVYLFIGYAVWRRYRFARRTVGMSVRIIITSRCTIGGVLVTSVSSVSCCLSAQGRTWNMSRKQSKSAKSLLPILQPIPLSNLVTTASTIIF